MIYDSLLGRQLDEYHLDVLLGQGGMARVYRAQDARLNRWVAIKVIDKPFRADQDYTRRFEREARAIAQLEHPHIVRLYRYGETRGLLYMVLQYIEGLSLDQLLATYRQNQTFIDLEETARIIREIGSALDYAHSKGVIHRDVKPANIILNKQGSAILVDFGLALLAQTETQGEAFGTPHYMAPEQVRSSFKVVPQSDLYALGVILYEMFTGRLPFEAENPLDVATLHLTQPPPPPRQFRPDLDPALEAVILKALAKEPEKRYPKGLALADALDSALKTASTVKAGFPPPTLPYLSIPERVRASLAERPLPSLPVVPAALPPELIETTPVPIQFGVHPRGGQPGYAPGTQPKPGLPKPPPVSAGSPQWPIYLGLTVGLAILVGLFVGITLVTAMFGQPGWSMAGQAETPIPPPVSTSAPAEPPPPSQPQLVADTQRDFSSSAGGTWEYLWSEAGEDDPQAMRFEERSYGTCWYAKDYVRICPTSGHPGNDEDIAWRWTSNFKGRVVVMISARKVDVGGDGVAIIAYHNAQAVEGLRLGGDDTAGVNGKKFFEAEVEEGDQLIFVMKSNERDEYDHTAFQVQIYRQG